MTPQQIADSLTPMEREWFITNACLYAVGKDLLSKGLTIISGGNIIETPLGAQVREIIEREDDD